MKNTIIADTGPLYAAVDRDDQYHRRATDELGQVARDASQVLSAYPTLCEAYTLVLYRLGRSSVAQWLRQIQAGAMLLNPLIEDYHVAITKALAFRDQKITLFDATVAAIAERLSLPVWTYDHHFDTMRANVCGEYQFDI